MTERLDDHPGIAFRIVKGWQEQGVVAPELFGNLFPAQNAPVANLSLAALVNLLCCVVIERSENVNRYTFRELASTLQNGANTFHL